MAGRGQFLEMKKRFADIRDNLDLVILKVMRKNERELIQLLWQQLYAGQLSDGTKIKPAYKKSTIRWKRSKGDPHDRVTLHDTGDFYKSIKTIWNQNGATFEADDPKASMLLEDYGRGPELLELTDENIQIFLDNYVAEFIGGEIQNIILGLDSI